MILTASSKLLWLAFGQLSRLETALRNTAVAAGRGKTPRPISSSMSRMRIAVLAIDRQSTVSSFKHGVNPPYP